MISFVILCACCTIAPLMRAMPSFCECGTACAPARIISSALDHVANAPITSPPIAFTNASSKSAMPLGRRADLGILGSGETQQVPTHPSERHAKQRVTCEHSAARPEQQTHTGLTTRSNPSNTAVATTQHTTAAPTHKTHRRRRGKRKQNQRTPSSRYPTHKHPIRTRKPLKTF
jgi:hypothetical protein